MPTSMTSNPHTDEFDAPHDEPHVDAAPVSRRGFGKRILLGASALAIALTAGKPRQARAAALTDTWKLGGNTNVNTDGSNFLGTTNIAPLIFKTAAKANTPLERMRILASGKIGIGTTSPVARLHIKTTTTVAVQGDTSSTAAGASGVMGKVTSTTPGLDAAGVLGVNDGTNSNGIGVKGEGFYGMYAQGDRVGVYAVATSTYGDALVAIADNGSAAFGVNAASSSGRGVSGSTQIGDGVYGISFSTGNGIVGVSTSGLAGKFIGNVEVTGTLSKGGGSFKIDHPLEPDTKYLYHSFVESPDMMNVYNGNVTTDAQGNATVELPAYFQALNRDFRYQLTVLGQFAQAIVADKIADNRFTIKTDKPRVEVSWQITGIRQDAFANIHRIPVEEEKSAAERGKYLHPKAHGKPETAGVDAEGMHKRHEKDAPRGQAPQTPPLQTVPSTTN